MVSNHPLSHFPIAPAARTHLHSPRTVTVIPSLKKIDKTSTLKANKDSPHPLSALCSDGKDPLELLDPTQHSIGYLYILNARCTAALQSGAELGPSTTSNSTSQPEQGSSAAVTTNPLYNFIHAFVQLYDPEQIRLVSDQATLFAKLLTHFGDAPKSEDTQADAPPPPSTSTTSSSTSSTTSLPLLSALESFLSRYSPPGILTAVHPVFLQGLVESRNTGREVTRRWFGLTSSGGTANGGKGGMGENGTRGEITDVDTSTFPIKYQDHLLYHYYGGVLLSLEKDYRRAIDFFEICISSPGSGISLIQLDAYKKLILIQLLSSSSSASSSSSSSKGSLPPYTHNSVASACKGLKGYNEFVDAYREEVRRGAAGVLGLSGNGNGRNGRGSGNGNGNGTAGQGRRRLDEVVKSQREIFEKDLNLGLVLLTLKAFRRRQIQRLTKTYLTLSIKEIAGMVDWSEEEEEGEGAASGKEQERWKVVESEVKSMILDGEIHGSIGSQESDLGAVIVTFTDDPELYTSHETVERVTRAIEEAKKLELDVAEREKRLERNFDWVGKAYNSASGGAQGLGGGFGSGIGLGGLDDVMGDDDWAE